MIWIVGGGVIAAGAILLLLVVTKRRRRAGQSSSRYIYDVDSTRAWTMMNQPGTNKHPRG